jgi:hypothetical protein
MRMFCTVCLSAVLALSPLALAKLSFPNDAFGRIEGALDFCSKADPQSSAKYQERKKVLVRGASDQEIAEARASEAYRGGYDAATDEMDKQPKDQVKKTCTAALEGKN